MHSTLPQLYSAVGVKTAGILPLHIRKANIETKIRYVLDEVKEISMRDKVKVIRALIKHENYTNRSVKGVYLTFGPKQMQALIEMCSVNYLPIKVYCRKVILRAALEYMRNKKLEIERDLEIANQEAEEEALKYEARIIEEDKQFALEKAEDEAYINGQEPGTEVQPEEEPAYEYEKEVMKQW